MRYFPDTNFLLQCKIPREIQWSDVTQDSEIEIFISRVVQQEIDRHKSGGNARRADRARRTSSLLRSVLESPDGSLVLCEKPFRILLKLAPRLDPGRERNPLLDLSSPDDRIVEEVLSFNSNNPDNEASLLTHDVPVMVTAHDVGLQYVAIPDSWLLPPEPTTESKQIAELQRRIATLEKSKPILELIAKNSSNDIIDRIDIQAVRYIPLSESEMDQVSGYIDRLYPKLTLRRKIRPRATQGLLPVTMPSLVRILGGHRQVVQSPAIKSNIKSGALT